MAGQILQHSSLTDTDIPTPCYILPSRRMSIAVGGSACSTGPFLRVASTSLCQRMMLDYHPGEICHPPSLNTVSTHRTRINMHAYLRLHILRIVLPVDLARGCLILHSQSRVSNLRRQAKLQVQQACLANVLDLGTCLADHSCLIPHTGAWIPPEDGERPRACSTRTPEFLF